MKTEEIISQLHTLADKEYQKFHSSLVPTLDAETIIGVRVPLLRKMAKTITDADVFFGSLPHHYYEENMLHSILLSSVKDFSVLVYELERFLPYIDNWAVCDTLSPKAFERNKDKLLPLAYKWMSSPHTYTCRFGIDILMSHFLKEDFDVSQLEKVAEIRSEEYYVKMMVAWYFATALAFQYDATLPYLTEKRLDDFTHQKTIQKAIESFRVTKEHKEYLKTLRLSKH